VPLPSTLNWVSIYYIVVAVGRFLGGVSYPRLPFRETDKRTTKRNAVHDDNKNNNNNNDDNDNNIKISCFTGDRRRVYLFFSSFWESLDARVSYSISCLSALFITAAAAATIPLHQINRHRRCVQSAAAVVEDYVHSTFPLAADLPGGK